MACNVLLSFLSPQPTSALDSCHYIHNKLLFSYSSILSTHAIFSSYLETTPITSSSCFGEKKIIIDDTLSYLVPDALLFLIRKESYCLDHYVHEKSFISRTLLSSCVALATLSHATISFTSSTLFYYFHTVVERKTNLFSQKDSWDFAVANASVNELLEFWHLAQAYKEMQKERSLLSKIYHCALSVFDAINTESCRSYNPADDLPLAEQILGKTFLSTHADPTKIQRIKRCLCNK